MDGNKELIQITLFDENGKRTEVILKSEDCPSVDLTKDELGQFEQAISDIACSSIDLTINPTHIPYGAHS